MGVVERKSLLFAVLFFFQAEDGIRDAHYGREFRRVLVRSYQVLRVDVESAAQMHAAVMNEARDADIFISVGAVADWRVVNASDNKLKKQADGQAPQLAFEANPDILADVARMSSGPWCVGFAAETENLLEYADATRRRKGVPRLVGNRAKQALNADKTELVL